MRFHSLLLLGLWGLAAVGCATIHNPLSLQDIAALRIVSTDITFRPDANISWAAAEQDFVDHAHAEAARDPKRRHKIKTHDKIGEFGGMSDPVADERRQLIASPEGKAFVQRKIGALVEARFQRDLVPQFSGTRDARLEVSVAAFIVPHAVQRAVLGGTPVLLAVTVLKDAKSGVELARLEQGASTYAGQGMVALVDQAIAAPLEERLVDAYVTNVRHWLQKK